MTLLREIKVSSIEKQLHIGIYGLIERKDQILVIRKSRGPYKGLFDLPGGRPIHGEPLLKALEREIEEETGIKAKSFSLLGNFSNLIPYQDSEGHLKELYHIALVYLINDFDLKNFNDSIVAEDVIGCLWISRHQLLREKCSPLLKNVCMRPMK